LEFLGQSVIRLFPIFLLQLDIAMTLNITLVTKWGIHQSADFRLMDGDIKKRVSDNSAKLLQLTYHTLLVNVTYCGIGRWRNQDTSLWLKSWLRHESGQERSFEQVVEIIAGEGSLWIKDIANSTGQIYPHTFIITAFINSKPKIALVSNIQRLDSLEQLQPTMDLQISIATIHRRRVVITGLPEAVSPEDAHLIESLGRPPIDIYEIQRIIAQVNSRAAKRVKSRDAISESCWVHSNLPGGSGDGRYYGKVEGKLTLIMLFNGIDIFDQLKLNPAPGREIQMVSSTTSVNSISLAKKSPVHCKPRIVHTERQAGFPNFHIIDVGDFGGSTSRVQSVNRQGIAVGESFLTPTGPSLAFIWSEAKLVKIGTLGGGWSMAKDINDSNQVVGTSSLASHDDRAFLWTREYGMIELGTLGGRHSNATAINNSGVIVGSSWTLPGENPSDPQERAFVWDKSQGMQNLGSLAGSWSRALDINDQGQVIGISPSFGFTRGFICDTQKSMMDIGTLGGQSCEPVAINNNSIVVGMSETSNGKYRPFIWSESKGMVEPEIPGEVYIRGISDEGFVIGDIELDIGKRVFVWSINKEFQIIPWYERHHSEAIAISSNLLICGQIIGYEMHCHGVIWSPVKG
jgi:probable HAF family extracellular repeat protein